MSGKTTADKVFNATGGQGSIIPEGLKVKADDRKSVLIVDGPKESIDEFQRYVSLFDVAPRTMTAQITVDAPIDKFNSKTSMTIRNNEAYSIGQSYIGLNLTVSARLNDDGTVTLHISTGKGFSHVVRTKFQKVVQIVTDDLLAAGSPLSNAETSAGVLIGKKNEMSTTVSIVMLPPVEDQGPKAIPPQTLKTKN
jgi:type II secretory pathway component GspD/PulD (secretin)